MESEGLQSAVNYIPNTNKDQEEMLKTLGLPSIDALFKDVPEKVRIKKGLKIPPSLSESELLSSIREVSEKNIDLDHYASFLGGGVYNHFVPSVVKHVTSRAEFYTAYTPYQPELSQGILQAIYEYQSLICKLTAMDVANASMYDGATAFAEAAMLATRITGRKEIVVAGTVHPEYRAVLRTYTKATELDVREIPFDNNGTIEKAKITDKTSCVAIQQPNFFGCLEHVEKMAEEIHSKGALFIVSIDPISLSILRPPGEYGADIVVGEGQSLGNQLSFGGPCLGIFATKKKLMRQIPGRIVGETVDAEGKRGFVLTLQTREQHIRREKATSNICTNEALAALAATVYLALMGKTGLRKVAELCLQKANYLKTELSKLNGISIPFSSSTFKEFVVKLPMLAAELNKKLLKEKIIGGLDLEKFYPELKNHMLLCVTELTRKEDMNRLLSSIAISVNK